MLEKHKSNPRKFKQRKKRCEKVLGRRNLQAGVEMLAQDTQQYSRVPKFLPNRGGKMPFDFWLATRVLSKHWVFLLCTSLCSTSSSNVSWMRSKCAEPTVQQTAGKLSNDERSHELADDLKAHIRAASESTWVCASGVVRLANSSSKYFGQLSFGHHENWALNQSLTSSSAVHLGRCIQIVSGPGCNPILA